MGRAGLEPGAEPQTIYYERGDSVTTYETSGALASPPKFARGSSGTTYLELDATTTLYHPYLIAPSSFAAHHAQKKTLCSHTRRGWQPRGCHQPNADSSAHTYCPTRPPKPATPAHAYWPPRRARPKPTSRAAPDAPAEAYYPRRPDAPAQAASIIFTL